MKATKTAAVIIGGYVNGYSVIQELHGCGVENIILAYYKGPNQIAKYSRYPKKKVEISKDESSLRNLLIELHQEYDYIVPFPTSDIAIEGLCHFQKDIAHFCFLPFNPFTLITFSDKLHQYAACDRCGIPRPKTCQLANFSDWQKLNTLQLPIIIKPTTRVDEVSEAFTFRNRIINSSDELLSYYPLFRSQMSRGMKFLASEIIEGPSAGQIFAYTAYCSDNGVVMCGWGGCKLSQTPNDYGVFSTASNEFPNIVEEYAKRLFVETKAKGLVQAEFKRRLSDGKFYLMELNFRSDMWNRVGTLTGVYNAFSMWNDAIGNRNESYVQNRHDRIVFCNLLTEILNLTHRQKYWDTFKECVFSRAKRSFVFFNFTDCKVFLIWVCKIINVLRKALEVVVKKKLMRFSSQSGCPGKIIGGLDRYIGAGSKLRGEIYFGSHVSIGQNTILGEHRDTHDNGRKIVSLPIVIGNDVSIGKNCVIYDGVVVGDGVIIKDGVIIDSDVF